jgi:hypothetical protein
MVFVEYLFAPSDELANGLWTHKPSATNHEIRNFAGAKKVPNCEHGCRQTLRALGDVE